MSTVFWHYFCLTRLHLFPVGVMVFVWPCLWAVALAAYREKLAFSDFVSFTAVYAFGATILHCAACVINDICDVEFDRQVERTKNRPLPSGLISLRMSWILLLVLASGCVCLLSLTNRTAFILGLFGLFPLHALYPLMKRWTWWPQAWLGIAINWSFPVAWLSVAPHAEEDSLTLLLFATMILGSLCFTIVYDTIYACQDRAHDVKVGLYSTAVLFGDHVRPILVIFACLFEVSLVVVGVLNGQTAWYYTITCAGSTYHFMWQFITWEPENGVDCAAKFKANHNLGYLIWAGILVDYVLS